MSDGSINWGLIMFLLLAFGVLYIWIQFWTTFFRLVRAHRQPRLQEAAAAASTKVPLLAEWKGVVAPLAPEKPVAEKAAPEIFESMQVRAPLTSCAIAYMAGRECCLFNCFVFGGNAIKWSLALLADCIAWVIHLIQCISCSCADA